MIHPFGPLVSGRWLAEHRAVVRLVDVRWYLDGRSGREAYLDAHLPGAVWLDLDTDLAGPPGPATGRHPLPSPRRFAAALSRVGIGTGEPVVCYDDAGGSVAARLWWLLHVLGEPVAVLDGGVAAWPGELTGEIPQVVPAARVPQAWPAHRFVDADELVRIVGESSAVIYDARTAQRFHHGADGLDPRPGHVPGAVSAPWAGNLGADGRLRDVLALRERYVQALERPAVAYCGSGVTACHDLLALHVAGIADTALYTGSWSQWAADPGRPVETG